MFPSLRRFLLIGLTWLISQPATADNTPAPPCPDNPSATVWTSPIRPAPGQPIKLLAVLTDGPADTLAAFAPDGAEIPLDAIPRGGPPWSLGADFRAGPAGAYRVEIRRGGEPVGCRMIAVGSGADEVNPPAVSDWNTAAEAFYAAWIEQLFDGPPEQNLSFPSLEPVLRDPARNFLHNHLGGNEDARLPATPDCADLPYFLRAYFAWKVGLPVSFRACDRGSAARPPRCGGPTVDQRFTRGPLPAGAFNGLMRQIADTVHSGSARTALGSDATDFYPVALDRDWLWPGTVYADPYGHTLMLVKWIPQTGGRGGLLLAVDAQPDNSVNRKRFWEGTFLFANTQGAGPGFKAFRPLREDAGGRLRLPSNAELERSAPVAPYADEQARLDPEDFYARVEKLIDPHGLAPEQAYEAMLDALVEQVEGRANSVETGEAYFRAHRGAVVAMPSGAAIFQTLGAWEDYSTPSRDMRLLIAMNVLAGLPERIVRHPELFALGGQSPEEAKAGIERLHARRIQERRIGYKRSDGSPWELSIAEVFNRRAAFEVGYNPNDCAEARWGAKPGAAEYATCARHAPAEQKARMEQYRVWFRETRRPVR
jgi:hypothetical protein